MSGATLAGANILAKNARLVFLRQRSQTKRTITQSYVPGDPCRGTSPHEKCVFYVFVKKFTIHQRKYLKLRPGRPCRGTNPCQKCIFMCVCNEIHYKSNIDQYSKHLKKVAYGTPPGGGLMSDSPHGEGRSDDPLAVRSTSNQVDS